MRSALYTAANIDNYADTYQARKKLGELRLLGRFLGGLGSLGVVFMGERALATLTTLETACLNQWGLILLREGGAATGPFSQMNLSS
jgi:hypothetical protein